MTPTATTFDLAIIWLIAGWAVVALGVALLLWALFRDRSRGRRRCPKCWYDMAGAPSLKCPECGREAKNDRALFRTRRKWGWVVVALLLVAAGFVGTRVPRAMNGSWLAEVPVVALRPALWMQRERARSLYESSPSVPPITAQRGTRALLKEEWKRLLIASEINRGLLTAQQPDAAHDLLEYLKDLGAESWPALPGLRVWLRKEHQLAIVAAGEISRDSAVDLTADLLQVATSSTTTSIRQLAASQAFEIGLAREKLGKALSPASMLRVSPDALDQAVDLCLRNGSGSAEARRFALDVLTSRDPEIRRFAYSEGVGGRRFGVWAEPALDAAWRHPILDGERGMVCVVADVGKFPHPTWFPRLIAACEGADPHQRRALLEQLGDYVRSDMYAAGQFEEWVAECDRLNLHPADGPRIPWRWIALQSCRQFPGDAISQASVIRKLAPPAHHADAIRCVVYHAQDLAFARTVVSIIGPSLDHSAACEVAEQLMRDESIMWVHATTIKTLGVKFADHECMRPVILYALQSSSDDVRVNACLAAAKLPFSDPEVMYRLEELTQADLAGLARVARHAFHQLSSRPSIADGEE